MLIIFVFAYVRREPLASSAGYPDNSDAMRLTLIRGDEGEYQLSLSCAFNGQKKKKKNTTIAVTPFCCVVHDFSSALAADHVAPLFVYSFSITHGGSSQYWKA